MKFFQAQLQRGVATRNIFSPPGEVVFVSNGTCRAWPVTVIVLTSFPEGAPSLQVHLCADEVVIVTVDPRTGRLTLRDTGDLAAAGRGPRFAAITQRLNDAPFMLPQALVLLRNAVSVVALTSSIRLLIAVSDNHRPCGAEGAIPRLAELPDSQLLRGW